MVVGAKAIAWQLGGHAAILVTPSNRNVAVLKPVLKPHSGRQLAIPRGEEGLLNLHNLRIADLKGRPPSLHSRVFLCAKSSLRLHAVRVAPLADEFLRQVLLFPQSTLLL